MLPEEERHFLPLHQHCPHEEFVERVGETPGLRVINVHNLLFASLLVLLSRGVQLKSKGTMTRWLRMPLSPITVLIFSCRSRAAGLYLGFVRLCSLDKVVVPRFLLLVSLHAESLVIFPEMRTRTHCVAPRPLHNTQKKITFRFL